MTIFVREATEKEVLPNVPMRCQKWQFFSTFALTLFVFLFYCQMFQGRFRKIMDCAQNALNQDTSRLTQKLDESEKNVFVAGQLGLHDFDRWETRQTEKLQTSTMVLKHRKRKRAALEDQ
jgi:hypothetical protein